MLAVVQAVLAVAQAVLAVAQAVHGGVQVRSASLETNRDSSGQIE